MDPGNGAQGGSEVSETSGRWWIGPGLGENIGENIVRPQITQAGGRRCRGVCGEQNSTMCSPPPNPSRTLTGAVLGVASSTSHRAMVWGSRAHQLLLFPFGLGSCHFLPRSGREADYLLWAFGKPPLKSFPLFNVVPSRGVPLWTSQCLTFSLSEVFFWLGYSICTSYFSAISAPGEQKLTWITGRVPEKTQTFLTPTQFSQAQPRKTLTSLVPWCQVQTNHLFPVVHPLTATVGFKLCIYSDGTF